MSSMVDAPIEIERPVPPPCPVSFEEFLAWMDEDIRAEWVDGEIEIMSPSNLLHEDVLGFLYRLIAAVVEARGLGSVYLSAVLMRLPTRPSGRVPDLLFVACEHADRLRETYLDGPADLVIEIVSPDSDARDHGAKFIEYEGAGIPEYWLIDLLRHEATFYLLGDDARYHAAPVEDGWHRSRVLTDFRLHVPWLWQCPLPPVDQVLPQTRG